MVWQAVGFYVVLFSAGMAVHPAGRSTRRRRSTARAGSRCSSGSPCRCCGTPSRSAGSTWASPRSTRSPLVSVIVGDRGGPDYATTVLAVEIYRNAFTYSKFGYASAMGVVLFFLTLTFAALTLRLTAARADRVLTTDRRCLRQAGHRTRRTGTRAGEHGAMLGRTPSRTSRWSSGRC